MKTKALILTILSLCLIIGFCGCSNNNTENSNIDSAIETKNLSFKEKIDIAMQNASDNTVLAKVNDIEITQTDIDVYLIDGNKYSVEGIVKFVVIADYAKQHDLEIVKSAQERINSLPNSLMENDFLTDEYCLKNYGISKEKVVEYMVNRSEQIWLNSAFSDMIIDEVSSGETPKKYPQLKKAYKKFERNKLKKGSKAWDEIEQAYYDMIVEDYDIVIY